MSGLPLCAVQLAPPGIAAVTVPSLAETITLGAPGTSADGPPPLRTVVVDAPVEWGLLYTDGATPRVLTTRDQVQVVEVDAPTTVTLVMHGQLGVWPTVRDCPPEPMSEPAMDHPLFVGPADLRIAAAVSGQQADVAAIRPHRDLVEHFGYDAFGD
jgi:hypothetical protein